MAHSYLQFRNTTENKAAYSLAPKGAIPDKPALFIKIFLDYTHIKTSKQNAKISALKSALKSSSKN